MQNIDSKTCASRALVRDISQRVKSNALTAAYLFQHYRVRQLLWKNAEHNAWDEKGALIKSLHSILQIGVFFSFERKIAVFKRPRTERDGTEKITSGFSMLKSWSPVSLHTEDLAIALAKKAYLQAGPRLDWVPRGLALSDIFEKKNTFAPHYLFVIYEIPLETATRLSTKSSLNERKSTEVFAGWVDPAKYDSHSFGGEFYDESADEHRPYVIDGAVDRMLASSLRRNDQLDLEDTTRGYSRYFPKHELKHDVPGYDFDNGELEIDETMQDLLKVVRALRASRSAAEEVTLGDVILFEPNFNGIGVRGPALMRWLRSLYVRAFN